MNKNLLLVLISLLLLSCNLPMPTSPAPTQTFTPQLPPSPTPVDMPGIIVRGQVTFNGAPLAGVKIYKRFSAYSATEIAVTDENGYYESEFINIPGDEMVSIEAKLAGYTFEPPYSYWRHYHGYEITTLNFAASPAP